MKTDTLHLDAFPVPDCLLLHMSSLPSSYCQNQGRIHRGVPPEFDEGDAHVFAPPPIFLDVMSDFTLHQVA